MQILKGIALGLVCFFLFIVLPLLGLAYTANSTAVNPQFAASEIRKLDIAELGRDVIVDLLPAEDQPYASAVDATLTEMKPWIDQQTDTAVKGVYAYLNGESDDINIDIQTGPFEQSLVDNFTADFLKAPPPEYVKLSNAQKAQYLAQSQKELTDLFPDITIDSSLIGEDGMSALDQAKQVFGYIHSSFIWLLVTAIALILLVILIFREIKGSTRSIGIVFLAGGAVSGVLFLIIRSVVPGMLPTDDFPSQIQAWIAQFANDVLSPWGMFSLGAAVVGALLIGISFLYRSTKKA